MVRYTIKGTAIPATYASSVGAGLGFSQGIAVDTSAPNETATTVTWSGSSATSSAFTVLGDAPCAAVVTLKGTASRTYYLATSATGRRVPVTTDANGMGRIDERSGFWLAPGRNVITSYSAASGTATYTDITAMSLFGTRWQSTGNQAAGSVTRFDLGPVLNVARTASSGLTATSNITAGYVFNGRTNPAAGGTDGLVLAATPDAPRIGRIWENRRNGPLYNSVNLFSSDWTTSNVTAAPGTVAEPFGYTSAASVLTLTDSSAAAIGSQNQSLGALAAVTWTASVYVLKDSVTTRQASLRISTTSNGAGDVLLNTSTGVVQIATGSNLVGQVAAVVDAGLWWRVSLSFTGDTAANTFSMRPAAAKTTAALDVTATGSATFACPQVELGGAATAYQAVLTTALATDHPNYPAGLVLEGQATNLALQSQFASGWTQTGLTSVSTTNVAPDGTSTAYQATSNAADSYITQTISGLTNGSTYTFSVWLRTTTGINTVNIYLSDGGAPVFTACDVGTYWSRFSVTRTIAATTVDIQIGGANTWVTGETLQLWGAQLEIGTAATSYMPTTTVATTRLADVGGVVNPHNLLYYSEPVSQPSIGTVITVSNQWVYTGWSTPVSSYVQDGPSGVNDALRITTTAIAGNNIQQLISPSGIASGKAYTFSFWIRRGATIASVLMQVLNQSGTSRGSTTVLVDSTWRRYSLTITASSGDTGFIVKILTSKDVSGNGSPGSIDLYGAQLVEGYVPGRYVRTTDTQVLPTTATDASWSQNGYIEAKIAWPVVSQPQAMTHIIIGNAYGVVINGHRRIQIPSGSSNTFLAEIYTSTTGRQVTFTDSTLYSRGYGTLRIEWLNYSLSGIRYCLLRLYADGVLKVESNFAGVVTAWPAFDPTLLWQGPWVSGGIIRGEQTTISNLTLGTPELPQGAVPAGI
jgi:hypothetical protein